MEITVKRELKLFRIYDKVKKEYTQAGTHLQAKRFWASKHKAKEHREFLEKSHLNSKEIAEYMKYKHALSLNRIRGITGRQGEEAAKKCWNRRYEIRRAKEHQLGET
jgi:hypothetical protein